MILSLNLNYICACVDMSVNNITVSVFIYLCMLYNIIFNCTSYWWGFLYLSGTKVIVPLCHHYICVCIISSVKIISMFSVICLCTLYHLIIFLTPDWGSDHVYFLVCYATLAILVDLH